MNETLKEALDRFESTYQQARATELTDPSLMSLATATRDGRPSVRTVKFTGIVEGCFTFFANRTSGKGQQVRDNPRAGLCFLWPKLEVQVTIDGVVSELSQDEADRLWNVRPRAAALMAWVSQQSEARLAPSEFDERYQRVRERYADRRVPRPPDWLAYAVRAHRIELWQGGWEGRHFREAYFEETTGWRHVRMDP